MNKQDSVMAELRQAKIANAKQHGTLENYVRYLQVKETDAGKKQPTRLRALQKKAIAA